MNSHVMRYRFLFPFLCLIPMISCSSLFKKDKIILNPEFSVNVAIPQKDFPDEDKLVTSKKEVFTLYGPPDFVRFWWSRDGRIHRFLEVDNKIRNQKSLLIQKHSWIYLDKNIECIFDGPASYREVPLNDKIRTVCTYGDPEDLKILSDVEPYREIWNYYSQGLILKFENDKLINQQIHSPMGRVIRK